MISRRGSHAAHIASCSLGQSHGETQGHVLRRQDTKCIYYAAVVLPSISRSLPPVLLHIEMKSTRPWKSFPKFSPGPFVVPLQSRQFRCFRQVFSCGTFTFSRPCPCRDLPLATQHESAALASYSYGKRLPSLFEQSYGIFGFSFHAKSLRVPVSFGIPPRARILDSPVEDRTSGYRHRISIIGLCCQPCLSWKPVCLSALKFKLAGLPDPGHLHSDALEILMSLACPLA